MVEGGCVGGLYPRSALHHTYNLDRCSVGADQHKDPPFAACHKKYGGWAGCNLSTAP